ncbi:hypothetical protein MY4824_007486 [Beauveria thailandica]
MPYNPSKVFLSFFFNPKFKVLLVSLKV